MKDKWLIVGVSAFVIAASYWIGTFFIKSEKAETIAKQDTAVFVRAHSPKMGTENAKVVVVEFFDPECESCRAVYPAVKQILKEFEGKTQLVMRYAPFHQNSLFAIKILEAARKQNKYWETLEVLFQSQPEWGSHHNPRPENIWKYLPSVQGLDIERVRHDMNDPATFDLVELDKEDGHKLGVNGTPTFFINGRPLERLGMDELHQAIRLEAERP